MIASAPGSDFLQAILVKLRGLPIEEQRKVIAEANADPRLWLPNPGPQTDALNSLAGELFFGGQMGGGKSSCCVGVAITEHDRSIVFRREYSQIRGLEDEATKILKSRDGYNSQDKVWRIPGTDKVLEFGSCPHEWDTERYQGRAHDFVGFDEIANFTRTQYVFLGLWLRSTTPGQRCRIIATGNRPTNPEGFWVVEYWAAWLDPTYHDPAKPGELRWPVPAEEGARQGAVSAQSRGGCRTPLQVPEPAAGSFGQHPCAAVADVHTESVAGQP